MGWTPVLAQAMSVPIYIVAAILTLSVAFISDRAKHRFGFAFAGCLISTIGYIILLNQQSVSTGVKYFALYTITGGGFIAQPILIGWLSNNMSGHYKKAIASAVQIGFGNCGGFVASNIFVTSEAPYYYTGYGTSLGLIWVTGVCSLLFLLILRRENRQREHGKRDHLLELPENEVNNLGDSHPHFRFSS
jgi:peptidoglycan/LPS O-acetylase OafA/YrhL